MLVALEARRSALGSVTAGGRAAEGSVHVHCLRRHRIFLASLPSLTRSGCKVVSLLLIMRLLPSNPLSFFLSALLLATPVLSIKFDVLAKTSPTTRCIWNYALADTLVIVTINTGPIPDSTIDAEGQEVDVEIVDASQHNNVYLAKKNVKGEARMAINTHSNSDLGVCVTNKLVVREYQGGGEE